MKPIAKSARVRCLMGLMSILSWIVSGTAQASVITEGCSATYSSCTMAELFSGGTIQVNETLFFDWATEPSLVEPDYSLIAVSGLDNGGLDPGPGIAFTASQGALTTTDLIDFSFNFRVSSLNPKAAIVDNLLTLNGFEFEGDDGLVQISESVFSQAGVLLADTLVEADQLFQQFILADGADFAQQITPIFIEKDILVQGGLFGDEARLIAFHQRFSQRVAEPTPLALWLIGLLAYLGVSRRSPSAPVSDGI